MTETEFRVMLASAGFDTVVLVEREPGSLDTHTHPFEARALIIDGEISIVSAKGEQHCRANGYEFFEVD